MIEVIHKRKVHNSSYSKWSVNDEPWGLSLTRGSNVLVTLMDVGRIEEYTTHGSLIRQINLDVSIDRPRHSIELSTGQFVVCHQGKQQDRVCIVDTAGRIIHSYGGQRGQSDRKLDYPVNLTLDTDNNVLVADRDNKRLVLFSSSLTHISTLKSLSDDYQLNKPQCIYLDLTTSRLFVYDLRTFCFVIIVIFLVFFIFFIFSFFCLCN